MVKTFRRIVFAHVSKDDTITVKHLKHDATLRLLRTHHQLSHVDKLAFLSPPEKDAVYLILFDNKERISVKFKLDLSNFLQLNAEIIEVCKYDIPSEFPVDFDMYGKRIFAYSDDCVCHRKLIWTHSQEGNNQNLEQNKKQTMIFIWLSAYHEN